MEITRKNIEIVEWSTEYLSETDRQWLTDKMRRYMDDTIVRTMTGGWPLGYQPGEGMPGALRRPSRGCPECGATLLHRSNCKIGFAVT